MSLPTTLLLICFALVPAWSASIQKRSVTNEGEQCNNEVKKRLELYTKLLQQQIDNLGMITDGIAEKSNSASLPGPDVDIIPGNMQDVSQKGDGDPRYVATNAVDGSLDTFASSNTYYIQPWWLLTFKTDVTIARVKVWGRPDCCGEHLNNVDITVDGVLCGHIDTFPGKGEVEEIICSTPLVGNHLKIQKMDATTLVLSVAEVKAYST